MSSSMLAYEPAAPAGKEPQQLRHTLDGLAGKVVGFIDNAKPNFNHLVDDLAELLIGKYGVAEVVKHRKRGQVPVGDAVMNELAGKCHAVIAHPFGIRTCDEIRQMAAKCADDIARMLCAPSAYPRGKPRGIAS